MDEEGRDQSGMPRGFLTNSWCIAGSLSKKCLGNPEHVHLLNGKAAAAVYPEELCRAICRGLAQQKKAHIRNLATSRELRPKEVREAVMTMMDAAEETRAGDAIKSLTTRATARGAGGDNEVVRPKGEWPDEWMDRLHEEEGGMDKFGVRMTDGREHLKREVGSMMMREGMAEAWDDVSGAWLDPALVAEARRTEM